MQLTDIEVKTTAYAKKREALSAAVLELNDAIEAIKRKHLGVIKRLVANAADAHNELAAAIKDAPHLFERPRSVIIAGIKVGYQKGKGTLTWTNGERVCELIEKHYPDEYNVLVKTSVAPVKTALAQKSAADLRRIGVTVEDTGDQVLIKPTDTAVDKLVSALLAEATDEVAA